MVISSDLHPPTFMYNTIHVVEISTIQYWMYGHDLAAP